MVKMGKVARMERLVDRAFWMFLYLKGDLVRA